MSSINLTEQQVLELAKCYVDPIYFIENYCWIELKEQSKIVPAKLYPYQKEILGWLINKENGLVLKSRRVGGSTIVALYLAWLVNFRRGVNALLLSRNEDSAKKLLAKVKFSFFNVKKHTSDEYALAEDASWMLNEVGPNNVQLFGVAWQDDEGNTISTSEVASLTTTSESGRGDSATFVFIDEMAFLPDQAGASRAARLTTTRGGHWLAISTPNGTGSVFHSLCMMAERKENKYFKFRRVSWQESGISQDEVDRATEGMSDADVAQEMQMEFIASGDPVFNPTHLAACYKPIEDYPEIEAELIGYKTKVARNRNEFFYFCGVDTAIGKLNKKEGKRDYHCFTALTKSGIQVYTYSTKEESLIEWAGNIEQSAGKSIKMTGTVSKLHKEYPGLLAVEINGPGQAVYINHELPNDGVSNIIPKNTNLKSKDQIIRQLILAVESHSIVITDRFTYHCMSVFQRGATPGSYSAPNGDYYDDPVMALAWAWDILLRDGTMEFSWGSTTDQLSDTRSDKEVDIDMVNMGYGPTLKKNNATRLTDLIDNTSVIVDLDLDISRIKEPEFNV